MTEPTEERPSYAQAGMLAGLLLLPGFVLSLITSVYGIDDVNLLRVYHADEARIVTQLLTSLDRDSLNPNGYFNYGYLYNAVGFWIAKGYALTGAHEDARFLAFLLRLIGLASFGLSLWVLARILRKLGVAPLLGTAVVVLFGSLPSLVHFREFIHPDTLQLLFTLLAVDALLEAGRAADALPTPSPVSGLRSAMLAAVWAGLAFGTKYNGIFIVPVIVAFVLVGVTAQLADPARQAARLRSVSWGLITLVTAGGLFVATWLLTNPYVIDQWDALLEDVAFERGLLARGRGIKESEDWTRWVGLLRAGLPAPVSWGLLVAFLAALGVGLHSLFAPAERPELERLRSWLQGRRGPQLLVLVGYCVLGFVHLCITVNARRPHYLFHLLPVALALCAVGGQALIARLPHRFAQRAVMGLLVLGASALALRSLPASAAKTSKYDHPQLTLGRWLTAHCNSHTRLLADSGSYVPPDACKTRMELGVLQPHIKRFKPHLIVLSRARSGRFNWKENPRQSMADRRFRTSDRDNAAAFRAFHQQLFDPASPFQVVLETWDYVVLERKPPSPPLQQR